MLIALINILVVLYLMAISFVVFHSLFDAHLVYHYFKGRSKRNGKHPLPAELPVITVQLPVYNEMYVVERLLQAVNDLDYPADKLEIQVLDDSTDETTGIITTKILSLSRKILHIRRAGREGYKAGALKYGLELAKGEFIVVFDADFVPAKDFLTATVSQFTSPDIGMVQTRWGHINKNASWLAQLQAMALDGHFTIEQAGRNAAGYFINFNGTAGMWRKETIIDAGNWQADTLTEDLDLSYRAQMNGWKFVYLEKYITPAELPPMVSALKSQQYRWTKGGAETARKNIRRLLNSSHSLGVKLHGAFHLVYSVGFVCIIIYVLLTVPLLFVKQYYPAYDLLFSFSKLAGLSFFIYFLHYSISYNFSSDKSFWHKAGTFIIRFPLFVSLFIGLSLNNSIGIIKGYLGIKSGFIRTPKFNQVGAGEKFNSSRYAIAAFDRMTFVECLMAVYFLFGIVAAIVFKNYSSLPLLFMSFTGFCMIVYLSFKELKPSTVVHT